VHVECYSIDFLPMEAVGLFLAETAIMIQPPQLPNVAV